MARPQRPLSAAAGPVQEFAVELRALRERAGAPPYRALAEQTNFAKATLSAATSGHRLPSWEVARAIVAACGGDVDEWHARWSAARSVSGAPPARETRDNAVGAAPQRNRAAVSAPGRWRRAAVGVGLVLAGAAITVLASAWWRGPEIIAPQVSSCDVGAVILTSAPVTASDGGASLGTLSVRWSQSCSLGWARFIPARLVAPQPGRLELSVHRISDGATTTLTLAGVVAAESDPLLTAPGCVYAEADVTDDGQVVASARTVCVQ